MASPSVSPAEQQHLVNYEHYFSWEARELKASALADLVNAFNGVPDVVTMHAGLPSADSFPLISITATTPHTTHNQQAQSEQAHTGDQPITEQANVSVSQQQPALQATENQELQQVTVTGQLISDAQQYMFHSGHPPLLRWARELAASCHGPPNPIECAVTSGAVNALVAAVSCLCDAGDYVLCEEFAYTHAPECVFIPRGLTMLPIEMDEHGLKPSSLRRVLETTPPSPVTGKPPRVLYIIPSGQNPTGSVMPVHRKQEVYQICREHGIIILEDDAYYWLQYPQNATESESDQQGLQLPPSFLSMDVDSRVLRIDTFSKLLGPGYRLGWVTGAPVLVNKLAQAVQAGSCGPCSLSQVVVSQLLKSWGRAGFEAFVKRQQALYASRAAIADQAAHQHLTGLATWQQPKAGMFMWLKLSGLPDVDATLLQQLVSHRVVIVPGRPFWTDIRQARGGAPCPYFRVTFGAVPRERINEGFARLGQAIAAAQARLLPSPTAPLVVGKIMAMPSAQSLDTLAVSLSVTDTDEATGTAASNSSVGSPGRDSLLSEPVAAS